MNLRFKHFLVFISVIYLSLIFSDIRPTIKDMDTALFEMFPVEMPYDPSTVYIDPRLENLLNEFMVDAQYYGYDTKFITELNEIVLGDIDTIDLKNETIHLHGLCLIAHENNHPVGKIILSEDLYEKDPVGFKLVFYHEIGHWMGKNHLPPLTESDAVLIKVKVLNQKHFFGIMHDGYSIENSAYVKEMWVTLRHNFFVRDMPLELQKKYTYKLMLDELNRSYEDVNRRIDECVDHPSDELCDELYYIEDFKASIEGMDEGDMNGLIDL